MFEIECMTNTELSPSEVQEQRAVLGCFTDCGPSESD